MKAILTSNKERFLVTILLIFVFGIILSFLGALFQTMPKTEYLFNATGRIDVTGKFSEDRKMIYELSGAWEFFDGQLIDPKATNQPEPTSFVNIPHSWGIDPINGIFGSASYRLNLTNLPTNEPLTLQIPFAYTAVRVFIDGEERSNSGNPHEVKRRHEANYAAKTIFHSSETGEMEIIVHVSNYEHLFTGIPYPIIIGWSNHFELTQTIIQLSSYWISAILLFYSFIFLMTYIISPDRKGYLYYGVIAFATAVRSLCIGHPNLAYHLVEHYDISADFILRIEYLATSVILGCIFLYLGSQYESLRKYVLFFNFIQVVLSLFLMFGNMFHVTIVCKVLAAVSSTGYMTLLCLAFFGKDVKRTKLMTIELMGFFLLFICGLVDLLGLIPWYFTDISGAAIAMNCCIQMIVFITLFRQRAVELSKLSGELEKIVVQRTQKLTDVNKMLSVEIDTRRQSESKMQKISIQDPLTHVYNRSYVLQLIHSYLSEEEQTPFSVILLDINHMREINEQYSYAVGDRILKNFAKMIAETFASEGILSRYTSDKFLFLSLQDDQEKIEALARKMRNAVRQTSFVSDHSDLYVTCCTGIAYATKEDTPENLVKRANKSLEHEKYAFITGIHF